MSLSLGGSLGGGACGIGLVERLLGVLLGGLRLVLLGSELVTGRLQLVFHVEQLLDLVVVARGDDVEVLHGRDERIEVFGGQHQVDQACARARNLVEGDHGIGSLLALLGQIGLNLVDAGLIVRNALVDIVKRGLGLVIRLRRLAHALGRRGKPVGHLVCQRHTRCDAGNPVCHGEDQQGRGGLSQRMPHRGLVDSHACVQSGALR